MDTSKLSDQQKSKIAVAHLMKNKELIPEDASKNLFSKLEQYEESGKRIFMAMQEAQSTLEELQVESNQLMGSIDAVVDLIAEQLPKDKVEEWSQKFQLSNNGMDLRRMMGNRRGPQARPNLTMAGSAGKGASQVPDAGPSVPQKQG